MIPNLETRYEVVESTSSKLVFRQQYSMGEQFHLIAKGKRLLPGTIAVIIVIVVIVVMVLILGSNSGKPYLDAIVLAITLIPVIGGFSLGMLIISLSNKFYAFSWLTTTTLDKDCGTIEVEACRISKIGDLITSRFNRHNQFPLMSTTTVSMMPVIVNRYYRNPPLYVLRLASTTWKPVDVFRSTNVEIALDLKRLIEGFLQGGSAVGTI